MIVDFFIIGGLWFWILCCIETFILFGTVENESPWGAFWSIITFVALIHLFGNADWLSPLKASPLAFIGWSVAYLAIGLCWSFGRLWFWVRAKKQEALDDAENYGRDIPTMPNFFHIKDLIATWVAYWPISMLWTLLRDILSELGSKIAEQFKGFYESIIRNVWGDISGPKEADDPHVIQFYFEGDERIKKALEADD